MSIEVQQRAARSPLVERVMWGRTLCDAAVIRPAESRWHLVIVREDGRARAIAVGPWTTAGTISYSGGGDVLWIRFALGVFMPRLPTRRLIDRETVLPTAGARAFRLDGHTWDAPAHDDVEPFVERLVRTGTLARDPLVDAALGDSPPDLPARTLRHRFLHAAGVPQSHVRQLARAQEAESLLRQGVSIADAMFAAGYYDQPHLTRALRTYIGYTPAQILRMSAAR